VNALAVVEQVETWTAKRGFTGPRGLIAIAVLATAMALLWRRRSPLASAILVAALVLGTSAAWNVPDTIVSPAIVLMCFAFALGAYAPLGHAAVGLAAFLLALLATSAVEDKGLGDVFFLASLYAVLWGAGRIVRSRHALAIQLADRAAILEHERDEQAVIAAADERARIARELHDVVAHCVNVMVLQAGAERPQTAQALQTIEETGRQALGELRRLLGIVRTDHRDAPLEPQPTLGDLPTLVARVNQSGLRTALRVSDDVRTLPPGLELSAYRIVQESLTNALKHAPDAHATVDVRYRTDALELEVTNDFGSSKPATGATGAGAGIVGMRERVALFAGTLEAGAHRDGGFRVRARLPVEPALRRGAAWLHLALALAIASRRMSAPPAHTRRARRCMLVACISGEGGRSRPRR